ncbi:hypothetical protein BD309DRAFT_762732 [Dichomitus squalens]|nr:hypothetical protein BD309DRAFT_762732 [Dichomitus squalens]
MRPRVQFSLVPIHFSIAFLFGPLQPATISYLRLLLSCLRVVIKVTLLFSVLRTLS